MGPERPNMGPKRADYRNWKVDIRSEKPAGDGMNKQTNKQMNGQTNEKISRVLQDFVLFGAPP